MSITLRTNLRRWAHCLSSLPIGQHVVTWPHLTAEGAGKCSFWLASHFLAPALHYGMGSKDLRGQLAISALPVVRVTH